MQCHPKGAQRNSDIQSQIEWKRAERFSSLRSIGRPGRESMISFISACVNSGGIEFFIGAAFIPFSLSLSRGIHSRIWSLSVFWRSAPVSGSLRMCR
ncbi:hypothetical protein, partial [Streptomyces sp. YPW6]